MLSLQNKSGKPTVKSNSQSFLDLFGQTAGSFNNGKEPAFKYSARQSKKASLRKIADSLPKMLRAKLAPFTPFAAIVAAVTTAATATAGIAVAAEARRAVFTGAGHIHGDGASLEFLVVELVDGLLSIVRGAVLDESDCADLGEVVLKVIFSCLIREVAYKQSGRVHNTLRLFKEIRGRSATGRIAECHFRFGFGQSVWLTPTPFIVER
jgi:hypothetical protein